MEINFNISCIYGMLDLTSDCAKNCTTLYAPYNNTTSSGVSSFQGPEHNVLETLRMYFH